MTKIILHQVSFLLRQKGAVAAFYILLAIVLLNFTTNVLTFWGTDIVEMIHPAKLLALSYDYVYESADILLLIVQLYPVLVVCPAGFSLIGEKNRKSDCLLITRIGSVKYYVCKLAAGFLATMIVFTVPFFIEAVLNCLSFPLSAAGDFVLLDPYDPEYISMTENYLFPVLYKVNPWLYTVAGILIFGFFSGIMGMLTIAVSAAVSIRYKIFLFLPVFVLLNISQYITEIADSIPFSVKWYNYLLLFDDNEKKIFPFLAVLALLTAVSVICCIFKGRRDSL